MIRLFIKQFVLPERNCNQSWLTYIWVLLLSQVKLFMLFMNSVVVPLKYSHWIYMSVFSPTPVRYYLAEMIIKRQLGLPFHKVLHHSGVNLFCPTLLGLL